MKSYSLKHARKHIPQILKQDNKTRGGKCLIIAGSKGQWGAALLCAQAAARIGSGYVVILDSFENFPTCKNPDFLTVKKLTTLEIYSSIAIGPGFQNRKEILKMLSLMRRKNFRSVVLDAEAVNTLAAVRRPFRLLPSWIITPHEGELARLLKISAKKIRTDRKKFAILAQKKWGCIVVLKGNKTLIAADNGVDEIQSGNPALAKAGSGDVLTGMIAGLLSQGLNPRRAACLGAFAHGFIADQWVKEKRDQLSLMASDLIEKMPRVLQLIR